MLCCLRVDNFSSGAVCLVLASDPYDADDYLHTREDFLRALERVA